MAVHLLADAFIMRLLRDTLIENSKLRGQPLMIWGRAGENREKKFSRKKKSQRPFSRKQSQPLKKKFQEASAGKNKFLRPPRSLMIDPLIIGLTFIIDGRGMCP